MQNPGVQDTNTVSKLCPPPLCGLDAEGWMPAHPPARLWTLLPATAVSQQLRQPDAVPNAPLHLPRGAQSRAAARAGPKGGSRSPQTRGTRVCSRAVPFILNLKADGVDPEVLIPPPAQDTYQVSSSTARSGWTYMVLRCSSSAYRVK